MIKKIFNKKTLTALAGLLILNGLVIQSISIFHVATLYIGLYILVIPGLLIVSCFTKLKLPIMLAVSLSVTVSIFALMLVGLLINTVLPHLGMHEPLIRRNLLIAFDVLTGVLYVIYKIKACRIPIENPKFKRLDYAFIWASIILPILASLGANSINNGGTTFFTMLGIFMILVLLIAAVIFRNKLRPSTFPLIIFCMAVTLLLMNSMRGWFITGHDVLLEYLVFRLTNTSHLWSIGAYRDPYNACLSITILPTYLQNLLHIEPVYIYKFVFQCITACTVINMFYLFRTYASNVVSFISAFIFISFPTYMVDMSMLNRQGIGFLFFSAFLLVMFTGKYFLNISKNKLMFLFGSGIVLSHYSTSYVTIAVLFGAYFINILLKKLINLKHPKLWQRLTGRLKTKEVYAQKSSLKLWVIVGMAILAVVWTSVATKTAKGITTTFREIGSSILHPLQEDEKSGSAKYSLVDYKQASKQELFNKYVADSTKNTSATDANDIIWTPALASRYKTVVTQEPTLPPTSLGNEVDKIAHLNIGALFTAIKQYYAKIMQVLLLVGVATILLGYKFRGDLQNDLPPEYIALVIAGIFMLVAQSVLPQGAIEYGLLRLFQQNLLVLALPISLGFLLLATIALSKSTARLMLLTAFLGVSFIVLSGFVPQLLGSSRPALTLNSKGFYYDAYLSHASEIDAIEWLDTHADRRFTIQSDRYFASTKMLAYAKIAPSTELLPQTIKKDSYVYLGYNNKDGTVIEYVNGDVVYYKFPVNFLSDYKDLIYNTGETRVFK